MPIELTASDKRTLIDRAQKGIPKAQHDLGWHYFHNDSFPKSGIRAYIWLTIAISNGCGDKEILDKVAKGSTMSEKLTNEEIKLAKEKAAEMIENNLSLIADMKD